MLRFLAATVMVLTLFNPVAFAGGPPEWLVRVFVNEQGAAVGEGMFQPESLGSGVLVSPTLVVTNNHIVRDIAKGDNQIQIMFGDWTVAQSAKLLKKDAKLDLALIEIKATKKKPVEILETHRPLMLGTLHGYGYGLYASGSGVTTGLSMAGPDPDVMHEVIELTGISARFGDSGGGVVNSSGKLIGVISMSDQVDTSYLVPCDVVKDFIKSE